MKKTNKNTRGGPPAATREAGNLVAIDWAVRHLAEAVMYGKQWLRGSDAAAFLRGFSGDKYKAGSVETLAAMAASFLVSRCGSGPLDWVEVIEHLKLDRKRVQTFGWYYNRLTELSLRGAP